MAEKHFIIVGNGPAGCEAAFTLRGKDEDSRITVISKGRDSSYTPHLLPNFIAGIMLIILWAFSYYQNKDADVRK